MAKVSLSKKTGTKEKKSGSLPSKTSSPKSKAIDYTLHPSESASAYNTRIAKARGDTKKELASMQASSVKEAAKPKGKGTPYNTDALLKQSQALLDQTKAQGDTPFAGSSFDTGFPGALPMGNTPTPPTPPTVPTTPEIPQAPDTSAVQANATLPQEQTTTTDNTQVVPNQQGGVNTVGSVGTPLSNPSVVDYLDSTGQPTDFTSRSRLASQYGISGYTGTADQNTRLLSSLRGTPMTPTETITPTSVGTIVNNAQTNPTPVSTSTTHDANAAKFGLPQTQQDFFSDPIKTIKDITKQVFDAMGLGQADSEIKKVAKDLEGLENERDKEIRDINDNPWLTEGVRVQQVNKAKEKWADQIDNHVNRLQLLENVRKDAQQQAQFALGTAIDLFDSERKFQATQAQMYYEQAQNEFDNAYKLANLNKGTSDMEEYTLAVQQGFKGDFIDYKTAISAAGRAPVDISPTSSVPPGGYDSALGINFNTVKKPKLMQSVQNMFPATVSTKISAALTEEQLRLFMNDFTETQNLLQQSIDPTSYFAEWSKAAGIKTSSSREV